MVSCTNKNLYNRFGEITSINDEYIIFNTEDGNEWACYYEDGYSVDERIIVTFDAMNTPDNIYDDCIVSIKTAR